MKKMFVAAAAAVALAGPAFAALTVGQTAPDFTLTAYEAGNPSQFNLKNALKTGPVVLYFFPGAFTPGCNIEAQQFAARIDDFKAAGAKVVGVTGFAGTTARATPAAANETLQDAVRDFSKEHCNGKFPVVAATPEMLASYGTQNATRPNMSSRTSYVIAKDGKVTLAYTNNAPNEHITETLKAVHALH